MLGLVSPLFDNIFPVVILQDLKIHLFIRNTFEPPSLNSRTGVLMMPDFHRLLIRYSPCFYQTQIASSSLALLRRPGLTSPPPLLIPFPSKFSGTDPAITPRPWLILFYLRWNIRSFFSAALFISKEIRSKADAAEFSPRNVSRRTAPDLRRDGFWRRLMERLYHHPVGSCFSPSSRWFIAKITGLF